MIGRQVIAPLSERETGSQKSQSVYRSEYETPEQLLAADCTLLCPNVTPSLSSLR